MLEDYEDIGHQMRLESETGIDEEIDVLESQLQQYLVFSIIALIISWITM